MSDETKMTVEDVAKRLREVERAAADDQWRVDQEQKRQNIAANTANNQASAVYFSARVLREEREEQSRLEFNAKALSTAERNVMALERIAAALEAKAK